MAIIRQGRKSDVKEITRLLNEYLSYGLATYEDVEKSVTKNEMHVVEISGKVVGVITIKQVEDLDDFLMYHDDVIKKIPKGKYYTVSHLALEEEYRGGLLAFRMCKEVLVKYEDKSILLIGWMQPDGWHAEKLADYFGFKTVCVKESFWYEDSIKNNYGCPHCDIGCKCSVKISLFKNNL